MALAMSRSSLTTGGRLLSSKSAFPYLTELSNRSTCGPLYEESIQKRWATKKAGGSTKNGRDSHSKRLGVKKFGGEAVIAGNIIIRQRGTRVHAGQGAGLGRDHTIFATEPGYVLFEWNRYEKHNTVHVVPDAPQPKKRPTAKAKVSISM